MISWREDAMTPYRNRCSHQGGLLEMIRSRQPVYWADRSLERVIQELTDYPVSDKRLERVLRSWQSVRWVDRSLERAIQPQEMNARLVD